MYKVEIQHTTDMRFEAKGKEGNTIIDGRGGAIRPLEVLLSSLGSCVGVYIRMFAEKMKLPLDHFSVYVWSELTKEAPYRFKDIHISITIKEGQLPEAKKDALLHFIKNCPAHETLRISPNIELEFK